MQIKVIPTDDIVKLDRQIKALKSVITKDSPKDKAIHEMTLEELQKHRARLLSKF